MRFGGVLARRHRTAVGSDTQALAVQVIVSTRRATLPELHGTQKAGYRHLIDFHGDEEMPSALELLTKPKSCTMRSWFLCGDSFGRVMRPGLPLDLNDIQDTVSYCFGAFLWRCLFAAAVVLYMRDETG